MDYIFTIGISLEVVCFFIMFYSARFLTYETSKSPKHKNNAIACFIIGALVVLWAIITIFLSKDNGHWAFPFPFPFLPVAGCILGALTITTGTVAFYEHKMKDNEYHNL